MTTHVVKAVIARHIPHVGTAHTLAMTSLTRVGSGGAVEVPLRCSKRLKFGTPIQGKRLDPNQSMTSSSVVEDKPINPTTLSNVAVMMSEMSDIVEVVTTNKTLIGIVVEVAVATDPTETGQNLQPRLYPSALAAAAAVIHSQEIVL